MRKARELRKQARAPPLGSQARAEGPRRGYSLLLFRLVLWQISV